MKNSKIKPDQYNPVVLNEDTCAIQFGSNVEEEGYNNSAVKKADSTNTNGISIIPPGEELYNNPKLYKKGLDNLLKDTKRK